jgi:hypothetical protein
MGSAISYGRRYCILAALGLATDEADDDGEAAKPRDLSEPVHDGPLLMSLKKEIDTAKDATDLVEWGQKLKASKRADKLSETEAAVLRSHYGHRVNALLNGPAEAPAPKAKGKAAE